jgi:hypothetical protein
LSESAVWILAAALLQGVKHVAVRQVDSGDPQPAVETRPGVTAVAIDGGLQIEPADALKRSGEESVDRDKTFRYAGPR